jgi:thymidylate kinase
MLSGRVLIEIEGTTCSGKSTFVQDLLEVIREWGIDVMTIDDCGTSVLSRDQDLLKQLTVNDAISAEWKKAKLELQEKVLLEQIDGLRRFAENERCMIALMDRGGASTAYHTIPFLSNLEKETICIICKEIAKMSNQTHLLTSLGFLQSGSSRYQKTMKETKTEERGIKQYLNKWNVNYYEINSTQRLDRINLGIQLILGLKYMFFNDKNEYLKRGYKLHYNGDSF